MRVLIVEDEFDLQDVTRRFLCESGFSVDVASDGEEGLAKTLGADYDAVVLDLMLPRLDGCELLRRLRAVKNAPVLVLTARDALEDRVRALNLGADDYLTKPFDLEELLARVRALIRRARDHPSPLVVVGDIEINTAARSVRKSGQDVELPFKEFAILELLMLHRGELVTRRMIYDHVYGEDDDTLSNVVDVYICNLRRKLGSELIVTRRGEGYMIRG